MLIEALLIVAIVAGMFMLVFGWFAALVFIACFALVHSVVSWLTDVGGDTDAYKPHDRIDEDRIDRYRVD